MAAVVSLVVVVTLILLVTRVATVALTMTGMSLDHARFQARSAFTGTGFTTAEAEAVVSHPARRRIVAVLMLLSGAGAISVLGTLILSFAGIDSTTGGLACAGLIVAALVVLLWLAHSGVDQTLQQREPLLARPTQVGVGDVLVAPHPESDESPTDRTRGGTPASGGERVEQRTGLTARHTGVADTGSEVQRNRIRR